MNSLQLSLCLISFSVFVRYDKVFGETLVPDITSYADTTDWFHIQSEQLIQVNNSTSISEDNLWLVEEYFRLKPSVAVAYYQNIKAKIYYTLVAFEGRFYYSQQEDGEGRKCKPDQRQDFFTMYPWRFIQSDQSGKEVSALLGIGAIWMNAIRSRIPCETKSGLLCSHVDKHLTIEMKFDDNSKWPVNILIERKYIIHEDSLTLIDNLKSSVTVKLAETIIPIASEDLKRINDLTKICSLSKLSSTPFPSLMRHIGESMQRNYHLSYAITLYNTEDPAENLYVEEWFSFTEKQQSILLVDDSGKHQYHHLFGVRNNHLCVNYKVEWLHDYAIDCHFSEFKEKILTDLPMSQRSIKFVSHELDGRPYDSNFDQHRNLYGLGAMLMNMHDFHNKHLVPHDDRDKSEIEYTSEPNEWIVDDSEKSGLRYHLFFRRPIDGDRNSCHLTNLLRLEIRKKDPVVKQIGNLSDQFKPIGSLNDDSTLEFDLMYNLLAVINIDSFATYLYPDELDKAFSIPRMCPPYDDVGEPQDEATSDQDPFPTFEQTFGPDLNYRISSSWSIEFGTPSKLTEYLYLDKSAEDSLTGRINGLPTSDAKNWTYYFLYARSTILRSNGEVCEPVLSMEDMTQAISSQMTFNNYTGEVRLYGVGGLWQLGSDRGNLVEYLGQHFSGQYAGLHKIWRIQLPNELEADFDFTLKKDEVSEKLKLSLHSILVRDEHRVSIAIGDIEIDRCEAAYVDIPSICDLNNTKLATLSEPTFQTFKQKFGEQPEKARFKILFDISMSNDDGVQFVRALETSQGTGDCSINLWSGKNELELWSNRDIDGVARTLMYQPKSKQCVRSANPSRVLGLSKLFEDSSSGQVYPQYDGAFMIANIWRIFGDEIAKTKDNLPKRKEVLRENRKHYLYEWTLKNSLAEISFEFSMDAKDSPLTLRTILIKSPKLSSRSIRMAVTYLSSVLFERKLPNACRNVSQSEIGSLRMISEESRMFYMSSQIVQDNKIYHIDEWLELDKAYRISLSNVTNFKKQVIRDYLILNETRESYNLTIENECEELFKPDQKASSWFNYNVIKMQQDTNLYGPLFIWSIIGDLDQERTLIVEEDNASDNVFDFSYMSSCFDTEVWSIKFRSELSLQVNMRFGRESVAVNGSDTRMILEEVEVINIQTKRVKSEVLKFVTLTKSVFNREQRHMLLIPKGRGCKRNMLAWTKMHQDGLDKFDVHSLGPFSFKYIASVDQFRNNRLVSKPITQTGWFGQCPQSWALETIAGLKISRWRRYNYDTGTVASFRRVISRLAPRCKDVVIRFLNEQTGACTISGSTLTHDDEEVLVLDLVEGDYNEPITIKKNTLMSLETVEESFDPIQLYHEEDGSTVVVYEARKTRLVLNSQVAGPASVIRTFKRTRETNRNQQHYIHFTVKLEIIVIDQIHLTIMINDLGFWNCFDLIQETRALDCHVSNEMEIASGISGIGVQSRVRTVYLRFLPKDLNTKVSISDFTATKSDIARRLGKLLVTEPDPIDPMQLGHIDIGYNKRDSSVWTRIELIEPLSPIHTFEELPNSVLKRSGNEMLLHMRVIESSFACSEWCGSTDDCVAFSYCSDHTCQILTGVHPGTNNLVNSFGDDDIRCSLYHKSTSEMSSKRVSDIVNLMRKFINSEDRKNKLTFKIFGIGESSSQYFAREIKPMFDNGPLEDQSVINKGVMLHGMETYVILKTDATFSFDDSNSSVVISNGLANKLSDCLGSCEQVKSPLCLYCGRSRLCGSVNVTSWDDYRTLEDKFEEDQTNLCTIYSVDYLKNYDRLSATVKPSKYLSMRQDLNPIECAAMCSLYISSQKHNRRSLSDCLSFDYCSNEATGESTCYIEQNHVTLEDFGDTVYATNPNSSENCMHFSKSLISDYEPIKERKFKNHELMPLSGATIETCTMICHKDQSCIAFEYCKRKATQRHSCYIKRYSDHRLEVGHNRSSDIDFIEDLDCVVYFLKYKSLNEEADVDEDDNSSSMAQLMLHLDLSRLIVICSAALALGFVIQTLFKISLARTRR